MIFTFCIHSTSQALHNNNTAPQYRTKQVKAFHLSANSEIALRLTSVLANLQTSCWHSVMGCCFYNSVLYLYMKVENSFSRICNYTTVILTTTNQQHWFGKKGSMNTPLTNAVCGRKSNDWLINCNDSFNIIHALAKFEILGCFASLTCHLSD